MKKLATFIITTLILTNTVYASDIKIQVEDYEIIPPIPPIVKNGTTLVPLRVISEALGSYVNWDKDTNSVTVSGGDTKLHLIIGDTTMTKTSLLSAEETYITLTLPAIQSSGTTMVPLRAISEGLGCTTNYSNNIITLIPNGSSTTPPPTTPPDSIVPPSESVSFTAASGSLLTDHLDSLYSVCDTIVGAMTMNFKVTVNEDKAPYHPCDFEVIVTLSEQSKKELLSLKDISPDSASYVHTVLKEHMKKLSNDIISIYPTAKFLGYYDLTSYTLDGENSSLLPNYTCSWANFLPDTNFTYAGSTLSTWTWFTSYDTYAW